MLYIFLGICEDCIDGGIFVVGGSTSEVFKLQTNHTELINQAMEISRCEEPEEFPSPETRFGMVGTNLGNATTLFCGGASHDIEVFKDCHRYL